MLKNEKGITLIALIITIIVMLILVGVKINIALNVGLFTKAETATRETEEKAILEEMLAMMDITDDGKINAQAIIDKMKEKYTVEGSIPNITITGKLGKYNYIVSETEIKIGSKGNEPEAFSWPSVGFTVEADIEYIAEDGPTLIFKSDGKLIVMLGTEVLAEIDAKNPENPEDIYDETGMFKPSFPVTVDGNDLIGTIVMNGADVDVVLTATVEGTTQTVLSLTCTKIVVDKEKLYSNKEVLKALGETGGTYNGSWTVIGEENGKTKLISTTPIASYTLGYADPMAIEAISIEGEEPTKSEKLERAIWSYKNAVSTLNKVAKEATGIDSARCINVEDIEKLVGINNFLLYENDSTKDRFYFNDSDSLVYIETRDADNTILSEGSSTGCSTQTFVNDIGNTVVVDSTGDEVILSTNKRNMYHFSGNEKQKFENLANKYGWLASTTSYLDSGYNYSHSYCYGAGFGVHRTSQDGIDFTELFNSWGVIDWYNYGVSSFTDDVYAIISI